MFSQKTSRDHWQYSFHSILLQLVRIARNADRCNITADLSVRPSVTFRCFVQTNKDVIVSSLVSDGTIILVSGEVRFIRIFALRRGLGGAPPAVALKWNDPLLLEKVLPIIGHKLETVQNRIKIVLITNRKSHMSFRLVPKSDALYSLR